VEFSSLPRIATAVAFSLAIVGCGGGTTSLPSPNQGTSGATAIGARAASAGVSGIYVAYVPNFDRKLGPAKVMVQIGEPSSACDTYAIVVPAPVAKGATSHFAEPYYKADVTLTKYARLTPRFVAISGSGLLGQDLGTLKIQGEVAAKRLNLRYTDKRGQGRISAYFIGACKPPLLGGPPPPPSSAFLGNWTITLGPSTTGNTPSGGATIPLTISNVSAPASSSEGEILFSGVVTSHPPFIVGSPPYGVHGIWTDGTWYVTIGRVIGTARGTLEMSTTNWFPPGSDSTDGSWYGTYTPATSTTDLTETAGGSSVSIAPAQ
jgi:hypothetical protein